jgi:twitching motility protein PilT
MIREGKVHQVNNVIQTNASRGMQTMDDALVELFKKGLVSKADILERCVDIDYVKKLLL